MEWEYWEIYHEENIAGFVRILNIWNLQLIEVQKWNACYFLTKIYVILLEMRFQLWCLILWIIVMTIATSTILSFASWWVILGLLTRAINNNNNVLHGIQVARGFHIVLQLLFAYDNLILYRTTQINLTCIHNMLLLYHDTSGHFVNIDK